MAMFTERKRTGVLFLTAICMNLFFFGITYWLNLPVWLDMVGTIYISIVLNFYFGFLTGIINSIVSSFFYYEYTSLIYYFVSISAAYITSIMTPINMIISKIHFLKIFIYVYILCCSIAIMLTFIVDNGIPNDYWSKCIYHYIINSGFDDFIATISSVAIIKFIDVFISMLLVNICYLFTPIKYRTNQQTIKYDIG